MAVRRVWRSIDADLFRFTTTDLREQHLALMAAFEEAARAGTVPWRMVTADYSAAIAVKRSRVELKTPVLATPWDPQLREAMSAASVVVFEEELRTTLLDEMALAVERTDRQTRA
jgi:hypothetical protein